MYYSADGKVLPTFLSCLPVDQFASLPRVYLFNEITRLEQLVARYADLIQHQPDIQMVTSLRYCEDKCRERLVDCWVLVRKLKTVG